MLIVIGYAMFVLVVFFGAPVRKLLFPVVLPVLSLPVRFLAKAVAPANTMRVVTAWATVTGGGMQALYVLGAALLARRVFGCSYTWLMGLGVIGNLLPMIALALAGIRENTPVKDRFVFPVFVITFLGLSYWLAY